jgi:hypothetical protein
VQTPQLEYEEDKRRSWEKAMNTKDSSHNKSDSDVLYNINKLFI